MKKELPIKPVCYKCGKDAKNIEALSITPGTNYGSFRGYCPSCKAELSWTYSIDDGVESWEFLWLRKLVNRNAR